jgi:hypothetical protein
MITLPPARVVELTPGELGLALLRDLAETNAWSEWNYLNEAHQGALSGESAAAIAGAFGWLRGQGFIGRDPSQSSSTAIVITPAGRRALSD